MTTVFTETWTGSNGSAWPSAWTTETRDTIQSNQGQLSAPAFGGTSAYAALSPTLADCEVVLSFTPDTTATSGTCSLAIAVRADSWGTAGNQYPPTSGVAYRLVNDGTSSVQRTVTGTTTFTGGGAAQSAWAAGTTYMVRFRLVGTHAQMRWWDSSTAEPGTWGLDVTSASFPTSAGSLRLGWSGSGSVVRLVNVDNLTVDDLASATVVPVADAGSGVEAVTVAAVGAVGDAGSGLEALTVAATAPLLGGGSATDAFTVKATVPLAETSTGTDALASAVVDPDIAQQADIDSLKASRTTDESNISSLQSSRTTDEASLSEAQSSQTTDESNISDLQSRVAALEAGGGSGATAVDKASVVNVKDHGAVGDGVTDDSTAIANALALAVNQGLAWRSGDDYTAHDHRGANVYFPSGTYLINTPIIMPRSGFYRSKTVGLVGQSMQASRIVAGPSFPSNHALIEWSPGDSTVAAQYYRVRDQVFKNLTLKPKAAVGSMAIWFALQTVRSSYDGNNINNVDQSYNLHFEDLVIFGDNSYHQSLIRLEGRHDYVYANRVCADTDLGTAVYNTRLFHFDDFTLWPQFSASTWAMYDFPGSNYSHFQHLVQGFRGGGCCMIWGRLSASEISDMQCGIGNDANTDPDIYIRDGGQLDCHSWESEGEMESGIFKFENCWNVRLCDFNLGETDKATAGSPGIGLSLVNVHDSIFENRPGPHPSPGFHASNSVMLKVDGQCSDLQFRNITGNGDFEQECSIDPAADNIRIDYKNVATGKRWNIGPRGVPNTVKVSGVNLLLTAHPVGRGITTATVAKDTWHVVPVKLDQQTAVSSLKVNVTAAASGGTAAGQFAIYTTNNEWNRPSPLKTDLASYGTADLTSTGAKAVTTSGLVLPAGDFWLAWKWTGTATTAPTLTCATGVHPLVAGSTVGTDATGYRAASTGGAPNPIGVDGTTVAGVALYGVLV